MRENKKLRLKFTEYQIMELLWLADKPLSVDRIVEAVGVGWTKLRKQQNVKACLNKLQKLGMAELKEPSIIILMIKNFRKADELSEKRLKN